MLTDIFSLFRVKGAGIASPGSRYSEMGKIHQQSRQPSQLTAKIASLPSDVRHKVQKLRLKMKTICSVFYIGPGRQSLGEN
jgi:hypothetical protein